MGYYSECQDEYGLSRNNSYLAIFLPAYQSALVFRVRSRVNEGYEKFTYGSLPITSGQSFATYAGGSATAPAAGVFPASSYMTTDDQFTAPTISGSQLNTFSSTDMWYTPNSYRERLLEEIQVLTPAWLRVQLSIPAGVNQTGFQANKVTGGVQTDGSSGAVAPAFGFKRGVFDTIHIPNLTYGFKWGNDASVAVYTRTLFLYAEYLIEIPKDPNTIFEILNRRIPARFYTLPVQSADANISSALNEDYGFCGFPIYPYDQRANALQEYNALIGRAKI